MEQTNIYDLVGVGIGPFNLGLAALAAPLSNFKSLFFDKQKSFEWHPGMLLEGSTLQVPFYTDLVTFADPCSPYSFLCFLKSTGRLFPFFIKENNYILRKEYVQYCSWVAAQLHNLYFGYTVKAIFFDDKKEYYKIVVAENGSQNIKICYSKTVVLGTGTIPYMPEGISATRSENVFHSSNYLHRKDALAQSNSIAVIGSGQSAAEIFYDLLLHWHDDNKKLQWFTKADRFFQMDVSKLSCELSTPDYINYFYNLKPSAKDKILNQQKVLFKGINSRLLEMIYDLLYQKMIEGKHTDISLCPNSRLQKIDKSEDDTYSLKFIHTHQQIAFEQTAENVILATGYKYFIPEFIEPLHNKINWTNDRLYDVAENYSIDKAHKNIFVQNAEMHSHGFNTPDLSLGTYRNMVIINEIAGYEHYAIQRKNTFQSFGAEDCVKLNKSVTSEMCDIITPDRLSLNSMQIASQALI